VDKYRLLALVYILFLMACDKPSMPKSESGFTYTYLLNTQEYLNNQLSALGKLNGQFIQVTPMGKYNDTAYLYGVDVDWKFYIKPFLAINMHKPEFDSVYSMSQVYNEATSIVDIQYKALYDNLPMTNMQILMNGQTSDITMIYAEAKFNTPSNKKRQYLLYKPAQLIQVKSIEDSWLGKPKEITRTLYFPANTYNQPNAIIN
jgi:hypothetical protein